MNPDNITEDDKALAEAIIKLLDNEELLKSYSEKAYERALFYSPEKYRNSIHEI